MQVYFLRYIDWMILTPLLLLWLTLTGKLRIAVKSTRTAAFLTFQWVAYPLIWLIGSMGLRLFNSTTIAALFVLLPVVSKAGFGFFNLLSLRGLPEHEKEGQPDQLT